MIVGEMGLVFADLIKSIALSAVAQTVKNYSPKDDLISQREAERLFGRRWLQQHIDRDGEKLFCQAVGARNCMRRFSRAQLSQMLADEQTNPGKLTDLIVGIYRTLDENLDKEDIRIGKVKAKKR